MYNLNTSGGLLCAAVFCGNQFQSSYHKSLEIDLLEVEIIDFGEKKTVTLATHFSVSLCNQQYSLAMGCISTFFRVLLVCTIKSLQIPDGFD